MRLFLFSLFLFVSLAGVSQTNDAGAWMYFMLEKDLPNKYTTGIELETRLNENLSETRSVFSEVFVSKKWAKKTSTTLTYRMLAKRNEDNKYEDKDRLALDAKYKTKIDDVGISYRFRAQRELGILGAEEASLPSMGFRHKLKVGYKLSKKWSFSLSGEGFYSLENQGNMTFTDIRVKLGAKYRVKKRNYLSFGYLVQQEYNTTNPLTVYNAVLGYTLQIK